jgi:Fe-S cluster assembly scaffold protein SufB
MASVSEGLPFAPTRALLNDAVAELDELGDDGGSALDPRTRSLALDAYRAFPRGSEKLPATWRHDYARLTFDDLVWSSGRMRVPVLPRTFGRPVDGDAPALALENAGGIVHLGSTYLEPLERTGDPRITLTALADAPVMVPRLIDPHADRFTALAAAFQNCGAFIDVPPNVALDLPLQVIWTSRPGEASAVFPQTVVRVGAGSHVTIIERHVGSTESLVCGTVDVTLGEGATCDYVVVQQADSGARLFMRRAARCAAGARIGWHLAELGGALVRTIVDADLSAPNASAEVDAFFFARGFGHADLIVNAVHAADATRSRTIVRTAATDRGHGRFTGAIRIPEGVHGADASLRDDALVLSRDAYLDAVPALEIASNDVRAYHAATVGSLDEEALFYVQSRSIPRLTAERMMALAFFEPAIAGFPGEALRDEVRTALDESLDDVPETFRT